MNHQIVKGMNQGDEPSNSTGDEPSNSTGDEPSNSTGDEPSNSKKGMNHQIVQG